LISSAKLIAASAEREYLVRQTLGDTTFVGLESIPCEDVVETSVTGTIDGKNYCSDFGIPIDYEKTIKEDLTTKTFAPGEHIISIPVSNIVDDGFVYECHEGYEPIGISTASHGKNFNIHTGSAVLYVNIEEVTCEKTEDNKYTEFGTPKEEVKVNIKK